MQETGGIQNVVKIIKTVFNVKFKYARIYIIFTRITIKDNVDPLF